MASRRFEKIDWKVLGEMSEGERRKLELRLAAARRLASPLLDDLAKERIEALIRDLEQKLAAAQRRDIE